MKLLSAAKTDHILSLLDLVSKIHSKLCPGLSKPSGGHPTKLILTTICHAIHLISSGKADTAVNVAKSLQDVVDGSVSCETVHTGLRKTGLKAMHWTLEDWKRVIWSDETKINHLGSDGRKWVWKKSGETLSDRLVEGTLKFGEGNLMMWGCMGWDGVGYACKVDGKMNANLYVSILEDELQNSMEYWGKTVKDMVFQQDNDPKHTSKKAKEWFQDHKMEPMVWPTQFPDLNPIERLWSHLKRRLAEYEESSRGINELWERVQKEWEEIDTFVYQNLISSMPRRIEGVLRAKGGYTKY
ncbi:Transposable element Tcb2 transposase [Grifola frondosa]|uniref:Transposable element Tcb2 transposase n=1 Tax=Grifola frondosa TaxID=5627 RepID=A0A1C7M716_GRIFR|nr:Transposable element Tcb2 transposase [Grifola frondosa]